ncbi:Histone deacetylase 4 [Gryganskiella cystojenkinii]|nr:Histone deacetylase 4 [Gryganskiella cystojenkinii]
MVRTPSQGSYEGQAGFYDDDDDDNSSDEQINVRNGIQGLNLQKSTKSSVEASRAKKPRQKTERPFKIGELVESMKSDTDGTWFAGRVVDLEDDPHDHINPKSVLIHFEGFSPQHDEWIKPNQLRTCSTAGASFLRYGPQGPEPIENWTAYEKFYHSDLGRTARRHTGLAYDRRMLLHKCQCNTNPEERHHPEQPERLVEILCQFQKNGMLSLVKWIQGREATIEELVAAHADTHVRNYCCTAAENKQYALENNIDDPELNTEDCIDEGAEAEGEDDDEDEDEDEEMAEEESPKKAEKRVRTTKRSTRGSVHVSTTATSADGGVGSISPDSEVPVSATATATASAATTTDVKPTGSEDTEMTGPLSPSFKEGVEIDLHSPTLGRRRSSMRGSAMRMSSLVSMSSTLYAQKEEDLLPEVIKASLAPDEEDDDDDKTNHAGPAPSEAALAVAGGMDPAEASRLPETLPQTIPKLETKDNNVAVKKETTTPTEKITRSGSVSTRGQIQQQLQQQQQQQQQQLAPLDVEKATSSRVTKPEHSPATSGPRSGKDSKEIIVASPTRISSRNVSGEIVIPQQQESSSRATRSDQKEKEDKKAATAAAAGAGGDKSEKAGSRDQAVAKTPIKKKGYQAVSPAPAPPGDAVAIRPPGLTFTMSCGQLGIAVDTTWNPYHSSTAAKVAAGSLITLVDQVVTGRCKNGFAIIRPPGHHAEEDEAMGFCFFNNVGVAANLTLQKYPLTVQKILVIDWDVHHGNGTQQIFYENPNVLYISLHRWDNGHFYPFTGAPDECGEEAGEGKNVNIAWSSYGRAQAMGDVEYIAAFWYVLLPIARQFQPDLVMVSAGFDAADGHAANIGGYTVSPQGFAILTRLVQTLAGGRVILSLEGGYEFEPLALSAAACLEELLPHSLLPATSPIRAFPYASFQGTLNSVKPNAMAVSSLHQVLKYQQKYWKFPAEVLNPSFRFQLPAEWKASNSLATRPRRERNTRKKGGAD